MEGGNTNPAVTSLQPPVLLLHTAKLFWMKNNGIHNFFQQLLLEETKCVCGEEVAEGVKYAERCLALNRL